MGRGEVFGGGFCCTAQECWVQGMTCALPCAGNDGRREGAAGNTGRAVCAGTRGGGGAVCRARTPGPRRWHHHRRLRHLPLWREACLHQQLLVCARARARAHAPYAGSCARTHTHARTHARARSHTHTHTHTGMCSGTFSASASTWSGT